MPASPFRSSALLGAHASTARRRDTPLACSSGLAIQSSGGMLIFSAQRGEPQIANHQRRQHRELILRLNRLAGPPIGNGQIAVHFLKSSGQILRTLESVNGFLIIPFLEVMESDAEPVVGILVLSGLQNFLVLQSLRFSTLGYQQLVQGAQRYIRVIVERNRVQQQLFCAPKEAFARIELR